MRDSEDASDIMMRSAPVDQQKAGAALKPNVAAMLAAEARNAAALDPFDVIVGERIRERRLNLGMSQIKLSALSTVGIDALNSIERGRRNPSLATLRKIARTLECSVCDLLPGREYVDTIPVKSLVLR